MAFPVQNNIERLQEREISGSQIDAAVDCWFTSTGKSMPRMVKIKDDSEEIITIKNIRVIKEEDKYYAGIRSKKYICQAVSKDAVKEFCLIYYPDDSKWKLVT